MDKLLAPKPQKSSDYLKITALELKKPFPKLHLYINKFGENKVAL